MVKMTTGQIDTYTDDLGRAVPNYRFKIREDKLPVSGFNAAPDGICLGGSGVFKHRHLLAEYPDGSAIQYPVANFLTLAAQLAVIIGDGANCVHLVGESWSFIPPNLLGGAAPTRTEYPEQPDGKTQIETGTFEYTSDVLGAVTARYKMETDPDAIFQAVKGCLANPIAGTTPCTITGQIQPRSAVVIANRVGGKQYARKTSPQGRGAPIIDCGTALLGVGLCVRYQGESVRNIQNIVAP